MVIGDQRQDKLQHWLMLETWEVTDIQGLLNIFESLLKIILYHHKERLNGNIVMFVVYNCMFYLTEITDSFLCMITLCDDL